MSSAPTPPWGLFGGECGETAKALVKQEPDDAGAWVTKKPNYPLKKNGSVTFLYGGRRRLWPGGGAACELIERDRRLGYVPKMYKRRNMKLNKNSKIA